MPLPKIATPTYELVLPSSDRKIKYRPFLVKEEKILIIAMESEDQKQITNAIKSVINNCILSRGIKVDKLSTFDIEYLFLNIRGKSVGEDLEVKLLCPDDNEWTAPDTGEGDGTQQGYEEVTDLIGLPYTKVIFTDAEWLWKLSPRLGFSHVITDQATFTFNYGSVSYTHLTLPTKRIV